MNSNRNDRFFSNTRNRLRHSIAAGMLGILVVAGCAAPASAQPKPDYSGPSAPKADAGKARSLTVAILDFSSEGAGDPDLGKQIAEILSATLSGEPGVTLVDRSSLNRTIQEHELNLTGIVKPEDAMKVGKLVGARLMVTGKAFAVEKQVFITAKIIGTETTLVDGVLVKGDKAADLGTLAMQLSEKVSARLKEVGPKLVADDAAEADPLPALKQKLAGLRRPPVSVQVGERHVAAPTNTGTPVRDPAAQTELRMLIADGGFKIIEGSEREQGEAGVELLVTGDAFSEFSARIGNLVSCSARVEVQVTDRKTGEVIYSGRETARAVDLSENIAGKNALQKAGRAAAIGLLQHLADTLKPAEKAK